MLLLSRFDKRGRTGFRQWLQEQLGEKRVQKVEVSQRLVDSAATLVQSSYGMSPTMARYMRAQAVAFGEKDTTMTGQQSVRCYVMGLGSKLLYY